MDKQENIYLAVNDMTDEQVRNMCFNILSLSNMVPTLSNVLDWMDKRRVLFYMSALIVDGKKLYLASTQADLPEVESSTFEGTMQRLLVLVSLGMFTGRIHNNMLNPDRVRSLLNETFPESFPNYFHGEARPDSSVQP